MRILKIDSEKGFLHIIPEIEDDLWHLERVIEKGDLVSGTADRKIKPKEAGEKPRRVKLSVTLEVDSVEFHRFSGRLRVSGKIVEGKPAELLEIGAQQSLEVSLGEPVKIQKQELKQFQVQRLKKAAAATKKGKVLLVVLDDEEATFGLLGELQIEEKGRVKSGKSGKRLEGEEADERGYFGEILKKVRDGKSSRVIVAGPGFTAEKFKAFLKERESTGKQFFFTKTNSVGKTGLQELVKSNALDRVVMEMQLVKESRMVEEVLAELGKGSGLVEYGTKQVKKAVEMGAVQKLLVADKTLLEKRNEIEEMMHKAEQMKGEVHLVNSEHEAGKKLVSLGGVAALLRYRVG